MKNHSVTAEDRNQISQGLYAYCRGLDRFDLELALSPFAPGAKLDYSGIYQGSAQGFMDWIWPIHARMHLHVHRVGNIFIDRNSDGELVSEAYVQVLLRVQSGDEIVDSTGNGRYIDRWVNDDGQLRIIERDYIRDATRSQVHVPQDMSSVRPEGAGVELTWARDLSDGSYRLLG